MRVSDQPMTLGRGLLAGLFTGMIASVLILIFNVIYRGAVELYTYAIVMPVSIFMFFPLMNLVAGGLYPYFIGHLKKGHTLFTVITLVVTAILALITAFTGKGETQDEEKFRGLLVGIEIIEGLMAAIFIPFFANHPTLFMTDDDIKGKA